MAVFSINTDCLNNANFSSAEDIKKVKSYLYRLNDQLQYMFANMTVNDNFSSDANAEYTETKNTVTTQSEQIKEIKYEMSSLASTAAIHILEDEISAEVTRATGAEGGLSSRITQNADQIALKVNSADLGNSSLTIKPASIVMESGDITLNASSGISLNSGNITLSGGNINLTSTSGIAMSSGNLTMTSGNITMTSGNISLGATSDLTLSGGDVNVNGGTVRITGGWLYIEATDEYGGDITASRGTFNGIQVKNDQPNRVSLSYYNASYDGSIWRQGQSSVYPSEKFFDNLTNKINVDDVNIWSDVSGGRESRSLKDILNNFEARIRALEGN